jgi:hypothetical protein
MHGRTEGSGSGGIPRKAWRSNPPQSSIAGELKSIALKPCPCETPASSGRSRKNER